MQRFFIALLMIVSVVMVGIAAPAHSAGMAATPQATAAEHGSQHSSADKPSTSCHAVTVCQENPSLCQFICAGMMIWLATEQMPDTIFPSKANWTISHKSNPDGVVPSRNERPPNAGLSENQWRRLRLPT
ncbi:hypothetical protein [Pseudaminobacter sp. NGMCC 1.201702]|uniref:hypothetical protein n=1 Tax=Pseudaminobacter sp. NGMCC 1.201702 TaxID=3391825 RepID=UPI0039F146D4